MRYITHISIVLLCALSLASAGVYWRYGTHEHLRVIENVGSEKLEKHFETDSDKPVKLKLKHHYISRGHVR